MGCLYVPSTTPRHLFPSQHSKHEPSAFVGLVDLFGTWTDTQSVIPNSHSIGQSVSQACGHAISPHYKTPRNDIPGHHPLVTVLSQPPRHSSSKFPPSCHSSSSSPLPDMLFSRKPTPTPLTLSGRDPYSGFCTMRLGMLLWAAVGRSVAPSCCLAAGNCWVPGLPLPTPSKVDAS